MRFEKSTQIEEDFYSGLLEPAVDEYVLSIRCTEIQLLGIKNFLTGQGIEFDPPRKIEF